MKISRDSGIGWPDVKTALRGAFENLRLFVINSKSDEALDYKKYEKSGHGLTAIAVGGLSLSRGLTIEGLCVSYMYRNTRMYDTLMQMGRWFGYRPGYQDLCRVHLSPDSIDWYAHIAEASEELRQQIKRMRRDGLSPKQFGLYVEAHPDSLLVTAANKMRGGEQIFMRQNFSGRLIESYLLPISAEINQFNEELIAQYWQSKFGTDAFETTDKGWIARDVSVATIEEFLTRFRSHPQFSERKSNVVSYLQALSDRHPVGDVLLISKPNNGEDKNQYRLGPQERTSARLDSQIPDAWHLSKDRVASRGDEKLGLSPAEKAEAERLAADDEKSRKGKPSDVHYRLVRKKPLLMIHVLGPVGNDRVDNRVPAFGMSFPDGHYDTEIKAVVNKVWLDRMRDSEVENPEEEDDYDD